MITLYDLINLIKLILLLLIIIITAAYLSFIERRLLALVQNRYGPNRVGPYGTLQVVADMIKMLLKEDWTPKFSNKYLFNIAPIISFIYIIPIFLIIPITASKFLSKLNIGVLLFLALSGISIYPIILASWASNNKYAMLGAIRAVAQVVSYELFLGLSIMGVVVKSKSFNLIDIVASQQHLWNIIPQFLGFINFFIASLAICHRHPFDHPESEQELVSGYHIEYSGVKFSLFFIGEYISMIASSAMIVTLFLGSGYGPLLPSCLWFILKLMLCIILFILIRASLIRPKYDHIIKFSWLVCLPISLINLLLTAFVCLLSK
ncbi:MAG: NADH-quinone oxidoreductase subunit NuoH [Candidatus Lightella neohaematopini]|nr:NADH-quinone oxidoreductase subunit NuoH [Candidatus Lightella neohaematopini]